MLVKPMPISELRPAGYNPRKDLKPGDAEYEKLKRSLSEFGYVEPVIWNKTTGNVVCGHQRLKVLEDLGHTSVDCVIVELDKTREKALNIALNKISGQWDESKLALLIADLDVADFDAELTGVDDEIQAMIASLDDGDIEDDDFDLTAALEAASFVERGDLTCGRLVGIGWYAGTPQTLTMLRYSWTARAQTWCSPTRPITWPSSPLMGSRSKTTR